MDEKVLKWRWFGDRPFSSGAEAPWSTPEVIPAVETLVKDDRRMAVDETPAVVSIRHGKAHIFSMTLSGSIHCLQDRCHASKEVN